MPETERLWVREAVTGVEETEEDEALLEPEPMPDVSREEREVDSQNWRAGRRGDAEDTVGLASPSATDGVYQRWGREARGISLTCDNGGPTRLQPPEARDPATLPEQQRAGASLAPAGRKQPPGPPPASPSPSTEAEARQSPHDGRTCLRRSGPCELPRTFFSWQSGDSGMKLMLISSTSELLEPAEVTLTESVASPLHRYCPHLSWSKDFEWELPLAQGSVLGGCRLPGETRGR